jgi:hypothetical protein
LCSRLWWSCGSLFARRLNACPTSRQLPLSLHCCCYVAGKVEDVVVNSGDGNLANIRLHQPSPDFLVPCPLQINTFPFLRECMHILQCKESDIHLTLDTRKQPPCKHYILPSPSRKGARWHVQVFLSPSLAVGLSFNISCLAVHSKYLIQ